MAWVLLGGNAWDITTNLENGILQTLQHPVCIDYIQQLLSGVITALFALKSSFYISLAQTFQTLDNQFFLVMEVIAQGTFADPGLFGYQV